MIKVLVVEDSPSVRDYLRYILASHPELEVAGTAANGEEALQFIRQSKPDVITMDIHMPKMDGLEATRRIMQTNPVPIIIVSASWSQDEVSRAFLAMEAGAVAIVDKPKGIGHPDAASMAQKLVQTVKLMSEVKVVKRWANLHKAAEVTPPPIESKHADELQLVAIGASTGGPQVLQKILAGLPKIFAGPIVIVQHIAAGFTAGLADWLNQSAALPVQVARHGEKLLPGHCYLAPDGWQTQIDRAGQIVLTREISANNLAPAVSYLFRSVADVFAANAIGVLLTGMGKDGAAELKLMKERGAITIAQDEESSLVYGMPGEAARIGAACFIIPPEKIVDMLAFHGKSSKSKSLK